MGWERGEAEGGGAVKNFEVVAYRERTGVSQGQWGPPGGLRGSDRCTGLGGHTGG